MVDLRVTVGQLKINNPIMPASDTFAEGLDHIIPFDRLGALVTMSFTAELRGWNPTPRVQEIPGGMLNSIGLPSLGVDYFVSKTVPFYRQFGPPLIASVS